MKAVLGWIFPAAIGAVTVATAYGFDARPPVQKGIALGVTLAALQTYLSTASVRWAWRKRYFWWVWEAGLLFRMVVFIVTAFAVYRYTQLSFVATMTSMVASTTVFMVVESATCLKG